MRINAADQQPSARAPLLAKPAPSSVAALRAPVSRLFLFSRLWRLEFVALMQAPPGRLMGCCKKARMLMDLTGDAAELRQLASDCQTAGPRGSHDPFAGATGHHGTHHSLKPRPCRGMEPGAVSAIRTPVDPAVLLRANGADGGCRALLRVLRASAAGMACVG